MNVAADISIRRLELRFGEIKGAGKLTITDQMLWFAGLMSGSAATSATEIAAGANLYLIGSGARYLGNRTLNLLGQMGWIGNGQITRMAPGNPGEQFYNPADRRGAPAEDRTELSSVPPYGALPANLGGGDMFQLAGTVHNWLLNPPQPAPNPNPDSLYAPNPLPALMNALQRMSAVTRAALASAYFQRWGKELQTDINDRYSGWLRTDTINYLHYGAEVDANLAADNSTGWLAAWDIARGVVAGLVSGAWQGVAGMAQMAVNLIWSPVQTVTHMYQGITMLVGEINRAENPDKVKTAIQQVMPDLYKLYWERDSLTNYQTGFLIGKIIGEQAGPMLAGAGITNLASRLVPAFRQVGRLVAREAACIVQRAACFAAGTPLLTPDGEKRIEDFRPGDLLLSASEHDPNGPIEPREVLGIITSHQRLWELKVGGKIIRTTALHPFYVQGVGWRAAQHLSPGDFLRTHENRWLPLDGVRETEDEAAVYNLHIAEYHTYFVGSRAWGFSVWAHNQCVLEYLTNLAAAGINGISEGAAALKNRLQAMQAANRWPYYHGLLFQAERTMQIITTGLIDGVPAVVESLTARIGGGFPDMLARIAGVRWAIDFKNWSRWETWLPETALMRARELKIQVRRYLTDPNYPGLHLRLEFKGGVPGGPVGDAISELLGAFGTRLTAVPI